MQNTTCFLLIENTHEKYCSSFPNTLAKRWWGRSCTARWPSFKSAIQNMTKIILILIQDRTFMKCSNDQNFEPPSSYSSLRACRRGLRDRQTKLSLMYNVNWILKAPQSWDEDELCSKNQSVTYHSHSNIVFGKRTEVLPSVSSFNICLLTTPALGWL